MRFAAAIAAVAAALVGAARTATAQTPPPPGLKLAAQCDTRQAKIGDTVTVKLKLTNHSASQDHQVLPLAFDYWSCSLQVQWTETKLVKKGDPAPKPVPKQYSLIRYVPGPEKLSPLTRKSLAPGESIEGTLTLPIMRAGEQTIRAFYYGYNLAPNGAIFSNSVPVLGTTPGKGTLGATIETSAGTMQVTLLREKSPATVSNFVQLARQGLYTDTAFFRLMPGSWLQGGDPKNDGTGGPGWTIPMEVPTDLTPIPHEPGTLSMCRGPNVNTAGSQFFFSLAKLPQYDYAAGYPHTVFGRITDGADVLAKLTRGGVEAQAEQSPFRGEQSKPVETHTIKKVTIWVR